MKKAKLIFLLVIALGVILRFWTLGADPSILLDSGQVGDEGYWLYNARNLALFGKTAPDQFYHDFAAAPLFSFAAYLSFSIFGVGFYQARLVSAIAGILTLIFTYLIASKVSKKVGLLSTFLVAINTMLLLHNRLAVGESLSIMFATAGFYFLFRSNIEVFSGGSMALSMLSKTTSFLYLPSIGLILLSNFKNKMLTLKKIVKFSIPFLGVFLLAFGFLYSRWGNQIRLIYSTFGSWYAPKTLLNIWQNAFSFFLHPFWGSPFLFSLSVSAILNSLNYLFEKKSRTNTRKLLILWLLGIVLLGPFISGLSNARLLGLIIPIAILAAQTLFYPNVAKVNFGSADFLQRLGRVKTAASAVFLSVIPAVIAAKIFLAIFKRVSGDQTAINNLPHVSVLILVIITVLTFRQKPILKTFLKLDTYILIFLPIAAFIPLFAGYLNFFGITPTLNATVISFVTLVLFAVFSLVIRAESNLRKIAVCSLAIYVFFNFIGIATIVYKPTNNIETAANKVGRIIGGQSFIGFYGHELSINNRSWPIYWAPRLSSVGGVNADYEIYNPKFILVTTIFDSKTGARSDWPDTADVSKPLTYIETLDLSRQFLNTRREFKMDVYKIGN